MPYPVPVAVEPGDLHQIDMIGPRHLFGAAQFHTLNLIDVGSHLAGNDSSPSSAHRCSPKHSLGSGPGRDAGRCSVRHHANFRGGIDPLGNLGPIVATCLDLGITPRFIALREPWRNGVIEHFNDVWDKSFFRTETFTSIDHLRTENSAFIEFHNTHHRYSAHNGASPNQMWNARLHRHVQRLHATHQAASSGPHRSRPHIRSNRQLDLFGKRITIADEHTHRYVTAHQGPRTAPHCHHPRRRNHPPRRLQPLTHPR